MSTVKSWLQRRWVLLLLLLVAWLVLANIFKGRDTLELSTMQNTPVTQWLNDGIDAIRANRQSNPVFVYLFNPIRVMVEFFVQTIRTVISLPQGSNVIPMVGWLGSLAIVGYVVYAGCSACGCSPLTRWR
jgi:glycine betaine/proline transport system permease protein